MIPRIIHQTGPSDKSKWSPIWIECQKSIKKQFPNFEYMFWTDEQIDELIDPGYKNIFPFSINKIDFARACFLNSYGGIYIDLDIYCYKNFYHELKKDVCLVQACVKNLYSYQNFLMASTKANAFWKKYFEYVLNFYKANNHKFTSLKTEKQKFNFILSYCGDKPLNLISKNFDIQKLPRDLFNPMGSVNEYEQKYFMNYEAGAAKSLSEAMELLHKYNEMETKVYTRHLSTGMWGSDHQSWRNFNF